MPLSKLNVTISLVSFLCCAVPLFLSAQKLPNIQTTGVWLPETVKIDGKVNEWGNDLSAYNKQNHLQYTLANDDKNLYLAIKSSDRATIGKIMAGGIAFRLKLTGQKANHTTIIYPLPDSKYSTSTYDYFDSVSVKDMVTQAKQLKVLNIKSIPDSLLAIYNEHGINTALSYKNGTLIYELMLPLVFVKLNENLKFSYTFLLEGTSPILNEKKKTSTVPPPPPGLPPGRSPLSLKGMSYEIGEATYFSGEYVLYKK